jgi:6-phosphogluconolactonase
MNSSLPAHGPIETQQPLFRGFRNLDDLLTVLADEIVTRLSDGVKRNGRASFVASGGTTPGALFDVLAKRLAPWKDVAVTLSDERWTEPNSERSNEHLVRTRLLVGEAAAATLVPMKTPATRARDAEGTVEEAIAAMPRPFDVVLLGMGTDGHTASLIPGSDGLAQALDMTSPALVHAVDPPNVTHMGERITLTLRALLDARWIVVFVRGEEKLAAYKHAMAGSDVLENPVRAVLQQRSVPVSIFWSE